MGPSALRIGQEQLLEARQELRLALRLEQVNLLELSEAEFQRLIREVESSPLFQKLRREEKLVHYQKFPRADISPHFYELKEEILADEGSLDVERLLHHREEVVGLIRRLGLERFKSYFLYPDEEMTVEEIAQDCGLKPAEVERIHDFLDDFSIMSEFYHPSTLSPSRVHYSRIASIERNSGGFIIGYFCPSSARGKYVIDHERFEELESHGYFNKSETKEIRRLLQKLQLINMRKDVLHRALEMVVERQRLYLESADEKSLLPFTQKEVAERLGVAPSTITRAIRNKSIDTPWGEERPLKDFFPGPKKFKKEMIGQVLGEGGPLSDRELKARLEERGISISRRSVARLRKELEIQSMRVAVEESG